MQDNETEKEKKNLETGQTTKRTRRDSMFYLITKPSEGNQARRKINTIPTQS